MSDSDDMLAVVAHSVSASLAARGSCSITPNAAASPNSTGGDSDSESRFDVNINVMNDITDVESEPQVEDCDVGGDGARSHDHAKEQQPISIVHENMDEAFRKLNPTSDQRESLQRFGQ